MIIHRILAKNVLKYSSLRLENLPENGLIGITGPNESGKSTIGETVCFALFGRSFSLGDDDLEKIILWGETHCSVELDFTASDRKRYHLERFLDDAGNHSAMLSTLEDIAGDEPLARGVEAVADKLYDLIGYEFDEFVESFYLAQREITTPHPHSYVVKTMAGVVTLEYCAAANQEDIAEAEGVIEETDREISDLNEQIDEIGIDSGYLHLLEDERAQFNRQIGDHDRQVETIDEASNAYQDALPVRKAALGGRWRAAILRFIMLILALATAGLWGLLVRMPEHEFAIKASDWLAGHVPQWQVEMLLIAVAVLAALFIFFWIRRGVFNRRAASLETVAQTLVAELDGLENPVEVTKESDSPETEAEATGDTDDEPQSIVTVVVDKAARERLAQRVAGFIADAPEVRDGVGNEQNLLRHAIEKAQERVGELDEAIRQEQNRINKADGLITIRDSLKNKAAEQMQQIATCELAGELIQGAIREVSNKFNIKLKSLVSKMLPLFTEHRYEHLQIADDLSVRAFSSEKRDFMDLDEISSGTQRQIMLAVRLALSQELIKRTVDAEQFLFLDEPFAFFDQRRTRSSLTVLPTLSDELTQIWIIGQEFPDDVHFDLHIECDRDMDSI
ncbi:MAG: ATPase [Gammaproteobacteria bacterium (ex Lamellibrachia satsuma)]|nr:MAG: AAA family ATPase [Gammaproteobacteria bacterium (ex Lamellibrachia satsuma)]RRS34907.1 MAG: ATPase [Gammaproteobacteria bacterium (ex Lamellibrachia satsuma)]RRS37147.1 MAG: ATPase [Gammaproteobacteria bacterium (ex Lamellibrachia satsuma)]